VRVSVDSAGEDANQSSFLPGLSADGRFVVFTSWASDMVPSDANGGHDVFVRDTCRGAAGACTPSNRLVSVDSNGAQANTNSGGPATGGASISGDGRFVAFGSRATNLVSGDGVGQFEIFLYDSCAGANACTPSTKRLSAALDGTQSADNERSDAPAISTDGRFVVFTSNSVAFLPGDTNRTFDVFLARTGAP
jgi:Tol biopolymer transport system component